MRDFDSINGFLWKRAHSSFCSIISKIEWAYSLYSEGWKDRFDVFGGEKFRCAFTHIDKTNKQTKENEKKRTKISLDIVSHKHRMCIYGSHSRVDKYWAHTTFVVSGSRAKIKINIFFNWDCVAYWGVSFFPLAFWTNQ